MTALAERDPPVARGAVVVHHQAAVRDRLASRPACFLEPLGHRRRRDHVARDGDDCPLELGHGREPGARREHDRARLDGARGRADDAPVAIEVDHGRALEDPDAPLESDASQPAREQRRLDGGSTCLERGAEMDGRARAALDLLRREELERLLASPGGGRDGALPRADLRRGRRRPEPAAAPVVGVDPFPLAECAELVHGLRGDPHEAEGLLLARALDQRLDLRPPGEREPAVSSRGAAAADVGLEEDDRRPRLELVDAERRPEARVAAADDADVGADVFEELRGLDAVLGGERLAKPERAGGHPR